MTQSVHERAADGTAESEVVIRLRKMAVELAELHVIALEQDRELVTWVLITLTAVLHTIEERTAGRVNPVRARLRRMGGQP